MAEEIEYTKEECLKIIDGSIREYFNCKNNLSAYPGDSNILHSMAEAERNYNLARSFFGLNFGSINLFPGGVWENPQSGIEATNRIAYLNELERENLEGAFHNSF